MILLDAGPLVAVLRADDQHHNRCIAAFKTIQEPLGTVWPVLAEVMFLLDARADAQDVVWRMALENVVQVLPLGIEDIPRIRELMHQYADLPMDLADAALVRVAERDNVRRFFTVDRPRFFGLPAARQDSPNPYPVTSNSRTSTAGWTACTPASSAT